MKHEFSSKEGWFNTKILPAIHRRNKIALIIAGISLTSLIFLDFLIPAVILLLVILERAYEYFKIPNTKRIISSLKLTIIDKGVSFETCTLPNNLFYPWGSFGFDTKMDENNEIKEISIKSHNEKYGQFKLEGFENMSKLNELLSEFNN